MDNPEALASLGTQDTGRRPTKQKSTIQHRKIKRRATQTHQKKIENEPNFFLLETHCVVHKVVGHLCTQ
jgi:hypothetical protein